MSGSEVHPLLTESYSSRYAPAQALSEVPGSRDYLLVTRFSQCRVDVWLVSQFSLSVGIQRHHPLPHLWL